MAAAAAAAAAALATAAKTSARWRHRKKIQDFYENSENEKIAKNIEKIDKNVDFGGATKKRTSPSNFTRKTTPIDLFSSPYD